MNSRQKGARGEREWRDVCIKHGYEARRGQQFSGSPDSPDVITNLPFHFEVKRVERLNINDAMKQAQCDCGNEPPVVAHKRNRGEWLCTMTASDFFALVKQGMEHNEQN